MTLSTAEQFELLARHTHEERAPSLWFTRIVCAARWLRAHGQCVHPRPHLCQWDTCTPRNVASFRPARAEEMEMRAVYICKFGEVHLCGTQNGQERLLPHETEQLVQRHQISVTCRPVRQEGSYACAMTGRHLQVAQDGLPVDHYQTSTVTPAGRKRARSQSDSELPAGAQQKKPRHRRWKRISANSAPVASSSRLTTASESQMATWRSRCEEILRALFYHKQRTRYVQSKAQRIFQDLHKSFRHRLRAAPLLAPSVRFQLFADYYQQFKRSMITLEVNLHVNRRFIDTTTATVIRTWLLLQHVSSLRPAGARRGRGKPQKQPDFTNHCLAIIHEMGNGGFDWENRRVIPASDYITRHCPPLNDFSSFGFEAKQVTSGSRTFKDALQWLNTQTQIAYESFLALLYEPVVER